MTDDPDRLDPDMAALFASERSFTAPKEPLARVWSRVAATLPPGGGGGTPGGAAPQLAGRAMTKLGAALVASFAMGGIVGAALVIHWHVPLERVVYIDRPTASSDSPEPPVHFTTMAAPTNSVVDLAATATPPPSSHKSTNDVEGLEAERKQLDLARTALAQGDPAKALDAVNQHERMFAAPKLDEEREAIAIQALVLSHRYDDARARASRFRLAHPNSVLLSAIETSLESIPDE